MIKTIGVIGAGSMGTGISNVAAQSGYEVKVFDDFPGAKEKSLATIKKLSAAAVEKGKQTQEQRDHMLSKLHYVDSLAEMADCQLIIEAIVEIPEAKTKIFKELDSILAPEAIIASNTSSISITLLAAATKRADRVAGMHFFNPAQVMKLVEIIRGLETSDETISTLKEVVQQMGKTGIEVKKDTPGFVVNRLFLPQMREAIKILEEGVATVEDIDIAMKLGLNHPMGPFTLQDFTGVDIVYYVLDYFKKEMGDAYAPPLLLKQMVTAGRVGRKAGKGWYNYE